MVELDERQHEDRSPQADPAGSPAPTGAGARPIGSSQFDSLVPLRDLKEHESFWTPNNLTVGVVMGEARGGDVLVCLDGKKLRALRGGLMVHRWKSA